MGCQNRLSLASLIWNSLLHTWHEVCYFGCQNLLGYTYLRSWFQKHTNVLSGFVFKNEHKHMLDIHCSHGERGGPWIYFFFVELIYLPTFDHLRVWRKTLRNDWENVTLRVFNASFSLAFTQLTSLTFFKKWANPGLFFVYFRSFQTTIQFLQQINVKKCLNVHLVYGAGIQNHNLQNMSHHP